MSNFATKIRPILASVVLEEPCAPVFWYVVCKGLMFGRCFVAYYTFDRNLEKDFDVLSRSSDKGMIDTLGGIYLQGP